jgi:hypothetical protein
MTISDIAMVRLYIDDPAGANQVFSSTVIQQILDGVDGDLHGAAAELWSMKAATVWDWYMSQTDGALLDREKVFQHCQDMMMFHKTLASGSLGGGGIVSVALSTGNNDSEESSEF